MREFAEARRARTRGHETGVHAINRRRETRRRYMAFPAARAPAVRLLLVGDADGQRVFAVFVEHCGEDLELGALLAIGHPTIRGFPTVEGDFLVDSALLEIHGLQHIDRIVRNLRVAHEHLLQRMLGDVLEYGRGTEEARLRSPGG